MDVDERIKKIILHFSEIFGPLPPPGWVKKLVTMDLELREEFLKDRVRSRPYPASKDDMAEITCQIKECVEGGLVYEYKKTDYPKRSGSVWIKTHPKYRGLAEVGYPRLKHYDVLDDLYDWEEDLQESLEAAAEDLAADPMDEDEELPPMEEDSSLWMPERGISPSRPTVPTPPAVEARPKRISATEPVTFTESEMKKQDYYFVERILRHTYKRGWRLYTKWFGYSISDCTGEPVSAFILDDGNVNEVFTEYCKSQDLRDIL